MKITLTETKQGLEITLRGKKEFKQKFPNLYPEPFDILEEIRLIGNGWDDGTDRCSFALTSSPIFCKGAKFDEETNLINDAEEVYYFDNYALENPFETLYKTGKVIFERA